MRKGAGLLVAVAVAALWTPRIAGAAGFPWSKYAKQSQEWYRGEEARAAAENVLSHQSVQGDWPSNTNTAAKPYEKRERRTRGTFDNGASRGELRFLARAYNATKEERYKEAFLKGLDHVLAAQYGNGGWPQSFPLGKGYGRHITFNDNTMVGLMELAREVAQREEYGFVDAARRGKAKDAFDRGVACILKCQVVVKGELTAWGQQHDEVTFEPRPARTFEPVSICGGESAGVVELLMSLDKPSAEVVRAVDAACRWFERVKIEGLRQVRREGDVVVVVAETDAPPLWARFYEMGTNRPLFCGRDGVVKYSMAEIERERRTNYTWYGTWPAGVLAKWPEWRKGKGL